MGQDEATYLRMRLLRLHEMNRILYPKKAWQRMEECLVANTTAEMVDEVARRILPWTFSDEAAREAEFALAGWYGHERYQDAELLKRHIIDTLVRFRISYMMDEIYRGCGYDSPNSKEELLESAAHSAGRDAE